MLIPGDFSCGINTYVLQYDLHKRKEAAGIYNIALREKKRICKKILSLERAIAKLPEGKLILCFDGKKNYKWFRSDGHTKSYIRRRDRKLAEQLAYKQYLTHQHEALCHEKMAIDLYELEKY